MAVTKPERNYSAYERDLIALVTAVSHLAIYLVYWEFNWRTDHSSMTTHFPAEIKHSSHVPRWGLALQPYRQKIELIKG